MFEGVSGRQGIWRAVHSSLGLGKIILREPGDFSQSPNSESRKNPQRWGKAGSKVTVTVAGFGTTLLVAVEEKDTFWVCLPPGFIQVICGLPKI